jgi:N-sulfoglucosamine sulfohydrolase
MAKARPRNVLLLMADKVTRTPNVDRLVHEGVLFPHAFCSTGSRGPSQSVIHSGLHNHANGHYGHAPDFGHFAYLPFVQPLPSLLKDAGYRTGVLGKHHVNPIERFRWDVADPADRAASLIAGTTPWFLQVESEVDSALGALEHAGQLENTLVILMGGSDVLRPGMRVPLIVRSPEQTNRGLVNSAMIGSTDLMPSILDFTGAKPPPYPLHGRSFLPVLEQENPSGWDHVFISHTFGEVTMYYPLRGIRTKRYKYVRNLFPELEVPGTSRRRPAEELYDLSTDRHELHNLACSPAARDILSDLRARVHNFRVRTEDGWLVHDRSIA